MPDIVEEVLLRNKRKKVIVIDSYKKVGILTALRTVSGGSAQKHLSGIQNNNYRILDHIIAFTAVFRTNENGVNEEMLSIEGDAITFYGIVVRKILSQRIIYRIHDSGGGISQIASPTNSIVSDGATRHRIVLGNDSGGSFFINIDGVETSGSGVTSVRWDNQSNIICRRIEGGVAPSSNAFGGFIYDFQYAPFSSQNKQLAIDGETMNSNLMHLVTDERDPTNQAINKGSEGNFDVINYSGTPPNEAWVRRDNLQPF